MNLIHKDFLIALANGGEVEYQFTYEDAAWRLIEPYRPVSAFDNPDVEFRIKPTTINLNYDVPKPFKPEIGEQYWFVDCGKPSCTLYGESQYDFNMVSMGAYRTKDDVIKVIEAQKEAIANSFANDLGDVDEK